jgi:L-lactate dehydrogenase complex protein LldE
MAGEVALCGTRIHPLQDGGIVPQGHGRDTRAAIHRAGRDSGSKIGTMPAMPASRHVSLFVTCLTDLFAPQAGMATVRVLEHFGCRVDFPAEQTCCGQPQFNNGFHAQAAVLARRMIEVFEKSEAVVTPSASCAALLREQYPKLLQDDAAWRERAERLAGKTYELVEYLTKVLKVDLAGLALPRETTVALHYTCHQRALGQVPAVCEVLVRTLGNARVVPLEDAEQCCGFGGTFAVRFPEVSGTLAQDKAQRAAQSGADVLVVNEAGCAMNIAGACRRIGAKIQVRHVAEVIEEAIDHTAGASTGENR